MSNQQINKYDNEQTFINDSDWFDIDAFLGTDNYESRKVSFGTIKAQLGGGGGANIYNTDGTLTGDRKVFCEQNKIQFLNSEKITLQAQGNNYSEQFVNSDGLFRMLSICTNGGGQIDVNGDDLESKKIKAVFSGGGEENYGIHYEDNTINNWDNTTSLTALVPLSFITANGTTANRPTNGIVGQQYLDTDINKLIVWNGSNWIDAMGTTV